MLLVLCLTEITSWGVLYYAFPVLAPSISDDTGWPVSADLPWYAPPAMVGGIRRGS